MPHARIHTCIKLCPVRGPALVEDGSSAGYAPGPWSCPHGGWAQRRVQLGIRRRGYTTRTARNPALASSVGQLCPWARWVSGGLPPNAFAGAEVWGDRTALAGSIPLHFPRGTPLLGVPPYCPGRCGVPPDDAAVHATAAVRGNLPGDNSDRWASPDGRDASPGKGHGAKGSDAGGDGRRPSDINIAYPGSLAHYSSKNRMGKTLGGSSHVFPGT